MRTKEELRQFLSDVLMGDASAIEFFIVGRSICHLWDDLVDRDAPVSERDLDIVMFHALVTLPSNAFYRKHFDTLRPLLVNAILNWHAANEFERAEDGDIRKLQLAFVVRSDYANLLIHAAYLIGGPVWARKVTPRIRLEWTDESFADYLAALTNERAARAKAPINLIEG
jgi:hypothetical protein